MKKLILIGLFAIGLTSCLKDSRYLDFANAGNIVDMPLSGLANFSTDAIVPSPDTVKFAVNYATAKSNKALTVTIGVDTTLIAKYNAANPGTVYYSLPSAAYTITSTKINIPAGAQYAFTSVIFDKSTLDPSKSYMLPVVIKDAQGVPISTNSSVHYFHIIGNDFAGAWRQTFRRWSGVADSLSGGLSSLSFAGNPATFVPVSSNEFVVYTGYDGGNAIHYDVTFTKNSDGTYSNFNVTLLPDDVTAVASAITFPQAPVFLNNNGSPTIPGPLTFDEAKKIFFFQYIAFSIGAGANRYIVDEFYK